MSNIQQKHTIYAKIQEIMTYILYRVVGVGGKQATEITFEGTMLDHSDKDFKLSIINMCKDLK